jgi:hypothetical protein
MGFVPALVVLVVSLIGFGFGAASCNQAADQYPGLDGGPSTGGSSPICIGPTCPGACAAHPGPGCPCTVPGQHLSCTKAEATYPAEGTTPGATVCGSGISVCNAGVWSACQLDSAVILVPNAPPGYYAAEGLGTGTSACALNPCDPACQDYVDTPTGITGPGLASSDAGITLYSGAVACVPKTCASLGVNCGVQSDGCGNALNCGTCTFPATCGGSGTPSVCGVSPTCTGLCLKQVGCSGTATTSISGTVYMPNGTTPLPNVLVYVPNGPLSGFTNAVECVAANNCNQDVSGQPLVATTSDTNGTFKLDNVPANVAFPVVLQLGRFRRQFTMTPVTACVNTALPACTGPTGCLTRFPQKQAETSAYDNIPKMAFSTGFVDALECVWVKAGINSTSNLYGTATGEFTPGNSSGRINLYYTDGAITGACPGMSCGQQVAGAGAYIGGYGSGAGKTPQFENTVLNVPAVLDEYDMVLFPCPGTQIVWSGTPSQTTLETNLANYVNAGGRVFSTHYSYIWLYSDSLDSGAACGINGSSCSNGYDCCSLKCNGSGKCASSYSSPLGPAIDWGINQSYSGADPTNGTINTSFPGGSTLANWLLDIGSSSMLGQMSINTIRHDFNAVVPPGDEYVSIPANTNTSTDPANCGTCGTICSGATPHCSNGTCAASCGGGTTLCGNTCTNTQTDSQNCGSCGQKCTGGNVCSGGSCSCPSSNTDPNNCGSCGNACKAGQTCSGGTCQCPAGQALCSGACTNKSTDPRNCGTCGTTCAAGQTCNGGTCACAAGYTKCGTSCVNLQSNTANCGACGTTCTSGGKQCLSGVCTCPPGYTTTCGGTCVETASNPADCGGCGTTCSGTKKYCSAGVCVATCGSGLTNCSNACVNLTNDIKHCGACGTVCSGGQTCVGSACVCPAGTSVCSGVCVNKSTDPKNCGSCGNVCVSGSTCVGGSCTEETNYINCYGSYSVASLTDAANCGSCGHACNYWMACVNGTCGCPGGYTSCGTSCVDTTTDVNNCGGCNNSCPSGQICLGSTCTTSTAGSSTPCSIPQQASFNSGPMGLSTPVTNQCGRVVFSDFHVETSNNTAVPFPSECSGGFDAQELLLAQALFDLAGCVTSTTTPLCTPTNCAALGISCGTTGDGCGGTLTCGSCTAPATCGGGGTPFQCGTPFTYSSGAFIRDYDASSVCANDQHPVWRTYSWSALTPGSSTISFSVAAATTLAGLNGAQPYPLLWSPTVPPTLPTGAIVGQPIIASAANSGATDASSTSPDYTLSVNALPQNTPFFRVIAQLTPTAGGGSSPTLVSWDMQIDCVDNE